MEKLANLKHSALIKSYEEDGMDHISMLVSFNQCHYAVSVIMKYIKNIASYHFSSKFSMTNPSVTLARCAKWR